MRQKNIANVFTKVNPASFTAIILAAGEADFIRTFGSNRSLVLINNQYLINHQINTLRAQGINEIIVVLGFDYENTYRCMSGARAVLNERWQETSATHSLSLALKNTTTKSAVIISGDIYFNSIDLPIHSTLVTTRLKNEKVGVASDRDSVSHLAFGLPDKWAQISYVIGDDLNLLRESVDDEKSCLYESMNKAISKGIEFDVSWKDGIVEINSHKDINSI